MKILLNIISFLLLFYSTSFPQFYADSVTPDYVIEFMNIADEFSKQNDLETGKKKYFTDLEIEHIAKLYFKCYNSDPVGFDKYVSKQHEEWERKPLDVVTGKMKLRPWMKVYALRDRITYYFGDDFVFVIGTPAFIRGKFLGVTKSLYKDTSLKSEFGQTNYHFFIEETLKGEKYFKIGDTLTCSFIHNADYLRFIFKYDSSYLVPIRPWIGTKDYDGGSTFQYVSLSPDNDCGSQAVVFPIENGIIKSCEYFDIPDTNWTDFKKYFKETYLIFQ